MSTHLPPEPDPLAQYIAASIREGVQAALREAFAGLGDISDLRLLRFREAAELMAVDPDTVTALVRDGELDVVTVRSARRITLSSIRAYQERHGRTPSPTATSPTRRGTRRVQKLA